jgi:uncharacterized protein (DUF362 family)
MGDSTVYVRKVNDSSAVGGAVTELLDRAGGEVDLRDKRVLLKPNLVAPSRKAVTSFEMIAAVADWVRERGGRPIVAEGAGFEFATDLTFEVLGVDELERRATVEVVNVDEGPFLEIRTASRLFPVLHVAEAAARADVIISLPRLKGHSLTKVTLARKNLMGLVHRRTRRAFHALGIERGISVLCEKLPIHLVVLDGLSTVSRAVYGHETDRGIIAAGSDVLAMDKLGCELLGVDYRSVHHIVSADFAGHTYRVEGDTPTGAGEGGVAAPSTPGLAYRLVFQSAFGLDWLLSALGRKESILPEIHWYLGVRPAVGEADREGLRHAADLCPIGAVDVGRGLIIKERCIRVRCLRCLSAEPKGTIVLKGLRKP